MSICVSITGVSLTVNVKSLSLANSSPPFSDPVIPSCIIDINCVRASSPNRIRALLNSPDILFKKFVSKGKSYNARFIVSETRLAKSFPNRDVSCVFNSSLNWYTLSFAFSPKRSVSIADALPIAKRKSISSLASFLILLTELRCTPINSAIAYVYSELLLNLANNLDDDDKLTMSIDPARNIISASSLSRLINSLFEYP